MFAMLLAAAQSGRCRRSAWVKKRHSHRPNASTLSLRKADMAARVADVHLVTHPKFLTSTEVKLELRAMTNNDLNLESAVMISSTIPSAK
jgi:hypothetical protein